VASFDPTTLPGDLPQPVDDGAADHVTGPVPAVALPSTQGGTMRVDRVPDGSSMLIVYAYPLTGRPGLAPAPGWDDIPGARGCTPESCGFRDHAAELAAQGAAVVGLSTQTTSYQLEAARRLRLPFPLLSDADLELARALRLPTFTVTLAPGHEGAGPELLRRLTFVVRGGEIVKVFYPVFPPDGHADEVLAWARGLGR